MSYDCYYDDGNAAAVDGNDGSVERCPHVIEDELQCSHYWKQP